MIPRRIIMENFMGHRKSEIDCMSFNSALIIGKSKNNDRESNGTGKSTIFKAIDYVLFNVSPTKTLNKIINDEANACCVSFEFELGSSIFKVTRKRNRKDRAELKLEEFINDKWEDRSQKTSTETEAELFKLTKLNYKAFKNSILFAQSDLDGIASASPQDRKALLKEPLQISIYSKFEKKGRERLSAIEKNIVKCSSIIASIGDPDKDIKNSTLELDSVKIDLQKEKNAHDEMSAKLDIENNRLTSLQSMLDASSADLQIRLGNLLKNKKSAINDINNIQTKLSNYNDQLLSHRKNIDTKNNEISNIINFLKELKQISYRDIDLIKKDVDRMIDNEIKAKTIISKLETDINKIKVNLPDGSNCPTCLQDIAEQHREKCEEEANKKRTQLIGALNDSKLKFEELLKNKEKYQLELKEATELKSKIQEKEYKLNRENEAIKYDMDFINKLEKMLIELESDKKILELKIEDLEKEEKELNDSINKSSSNTEEINLKINDTRNILSKIRGDMNASMDKILKYNSLIGSLEERIKTRTEDLNKLKEKTDELNELNASYSLYEKVVFSFSSSGIPTLIINTILDDLQIEANILLNDLRPGLQLQFVSNEEKDELEMIFFVNGKEREWDQLGGGQKVYISLSLKLGLSFVIQKRLGVDIKFLELDEVDSPLDRAGVDAYAEVIKKWQDKFKIFVITHNEYLKDKFNHFILVEQDEISGSIAKSVASI